MIEVRLATLEDWPTLAEGFQEFLKSRYTERFDLNFENFRKFFLMSLNNPKLAIVTSWYDGKLIGLTIIYELVLPYVDTIMRRTHIHIAAWIPEYFKVPLRVARAIGDKTMNFIELWGAIRGHDGILANTRVSMPGKNNYKYRAVEKRYGFELAHTTIFKPIRPRTAEELQKEVENYGQ